jgi:hypothetical protein
MKESSPNELMKTQEILREFKREHPSLVALNPEIIVDQILWSSSEDWAESETPTYDIQVRHPFVFDVRLIPSEFRGIPVKNVWIGDFPEEFPSDDEEIRLEVWCAPGNYERFVARCLSLIAETIRQPNLTKEEALHALTGDFQKHKKWCERLCKERRRS